MKILILSNLYPNNQLRKGIFVHQQAKEIIKKGHEIRVISPVPWVPGFMKNINKTWGQYCDIVDQYTFEGIKARYPKNIVLPYHLFYLFRCDLYPYAIKKHVEEVYKEFPFDLVHVHAAMPNGAGGKYIKEKYNKKLIITIHGADLTFFINRPHWKKYLLKTLKSADKVTLVSNKLKNKLIESYPDFDSNKIIVINNGINIDEFKNIKADKLKEQFKNKTILLSVSNISKTKGHDFVIRILPKLLGEFPNLIYLIIGSGEEEENLKKLVQELNLDDIVYFLGFKEYDEVIKYMSICDIFVLPSYIEGFGIVYLEAMALGKPVIGCKTQGIEDFVTDKITGFLVEPKSNEDLYNCLRNTLINKELTKDVALRGYKQVINSFALEKIIDNYIDIYRELSK